MPSLALGVGILLIIVQALAAVPVCSILISNANDAPQNEEVARYQRTDIPRELSKRIHGARSYVWNKKFELFSGSGRSLRKTFILGFW